MKPMTILWKRLVTNGETCPRCGDTGRELEVAVNKLKVVLGHGGEGLHYWLPRLDGMHANFKAPEGRRPTLQMAPSDYIRRNFAITTSGMNWAPAVRFAIDAIGIDQVMFAIDYPFVDSGKSVAEMDAIALPEADKAKIYHENAERIFRIAPGT